MLPRHPPPPPDEVLETGAHLVSILEVGMSGCPAFLFRNDHILIGDLAPDPPPRRGRGSRDRSARDLVFLDADGTSRLRIRRSARRLLSWEILRGERVVCRIRRTSPLLNVYAIVLAAGTTWHFKMPLFMVRYFARSEEGDHLWSMVGGGRAVWVFLIPSDHASPELVAALTFIHRDSWLHG